MQKFTNRPFAKPLHPLLIVAAFMLYQALYYGRFGQFGRFFLALVVALGIEKQQRPTGEGK